MIQRTCFCMAGLAVSLLAGCYVPPPVTHAQLSVSPAGAYTLDEHAVAATELAQALAAKRASAATLRVDLHASAQAEMKAIEFAVAAAREAQVKVDFTHDLSAEAQAQARLQAEAASGPAR